MGGLDRMRADCRVFVNRVSIFQVHAKIGPGTERINNNTHKTTTTIHTRQLTTIHTRQLTTIHTRQLTTIHTRHLTTIHTRQLQQYTQDN